VRQLHDHRRVPTPTPAQLADTRALREDAEARGWDSEVARHSRVIASLQRHLDRATDKPPKAQPSSHGR
jgi:hypothetical protein